MIRSLPQNLFSPVTQPPASTPHTFWNKCGYLALWSSSRDTSCCLACCTRSRATGRWRMAWYVV